MNILNIHPNFDIDIESIYISDNKWSIEIMVEIHIEDSLPDISSKLFVATLSDINEYVNNVASNLSIILDHISIYIHIYIYYTL